MFNFNYALRHYSYHPTLPRTFACYNEQVTGRPLNIDGRVATTIFLKNKSARDRAVKEGWVDETGAVMEHLKISVEKSKKTTKRKGRPKKV